LSLQISLAESSRDPEQLKQIPEWKKQIAEKQGAAVQTVRQALALAKNDSPIKDVNKLRYTLAYFLFNQGDFYDAAVISDYVARRFSDYDLAPACGEIALKAYVRLYQTSPEEKSKREFEAGQISSIANYLMTTWPNEPVAQEAVNWFLYLAVDRQQLDKASALLDKLPADSPARAEAEIRIGRMLWSEYLKASRLKDERPPQADLDKQLAQAQSTLEAGVKAALGRDSITAGIVDGAHALIQIYLDSSQPAKAIELLENDKLGPLKLANDGHPATQREGVPFEIYRSALRAYITAEPPRLDDALKIMDRLDAAAGTDPKAGENLVQVYIAMGRDLQQQLEVLSNRKDTAGLKAVSQAVEAFLKRAAARDKGVNFNTLNWMANTFYSLGRGFDSSDGEPRNPSRPVDTTVLPSELNANQFGASVRTPADDRTAPLRVSISWMPRSTPTAAVSPSALSASAW
jgi:tetratricopeptide (TPR) repeat protein